MSSSSVITKTFNAVLFLYLCASSIISYLFDPESDAKVPWDVVFEWFPSFAIIAAVVMILIMALWGALLVKIFWNRFISDVVKVRIISYDESLAIVLIIAILSI